MFFVHPSLSFFQLHFMMRAAIWSLNKKCHPLLTRRHRNREPKMWNAQQQLVFANQNRIRRSRSSCQKVLNIACRACSSNRPISRASDWPIFSCLGSTTSRWKTLEQHGSVFLLQPSYAYIQPIHLSHHIPTTNTLKPSYNNIQSISIVHLNQQPK